MIFMVGTTYTLTFHLFCDIRIKKVIQDMLLWVGVLIGWFFAGNRFIKIAKSPMSATIAFQYEVTAAGIEQMGDETFDAGDGGRNMIQWLAPYPLHFLSLKILVDDFHE